MTGKWIYDPKELMANTPYYTDDPDNGRQYHVQVRLRA
jgi:hypothetical protein